MIPFDGRSLCYVFFFTFKFHKKIYEPELIFGFEFISVSRIVFFFFGFLRSLIGLSQSLKYFIDILGQKLVEKRVLGQENLISDFASIKVAKI